MKIRPVGGGLFHTERERERERDRQTDSTNLTVAFRNFAIATKRIIQLQLQIRGDSIDLAKFGNKIKKEANAEKRRKSRSEQ